MGDEQKDVLLIDVVGVPWFSTRRLRYCCSQGL
jgi:hypothetical protein